MSRPRPVLALRKRRWDRQRRTPPRVPRGWTTGPPDFIGVGTQKAGTSWWYQLVARHPGVTTRGHPKELHYFGRFGDSFGPTEAAAYARWFPRPRSKIAGEWTPNYIDDPDIPARIALAAPDARLLVCLRDPVERYRSAIAMRASGVPTGAALTDELVAGVLPAYIESDARRKGEYVRQLESLFAAVDRSRVLVLQYERCVADLRGRLEATYEFLGLDPGFVPALARRGVHVSRPLGLSEDYRARLVELYEPDVRRLIALDVGVDVGLWPNFRHLA